MDDLLVSRYIFGSHGLGIEAVQKHRHFELQRSPCRLDFHCLFLRRYLESPGNDESYICRWGCDHCVDSRRTVYGLLLRQLSRTKLMELRHAVPGRRRIL